MYKKARCTCKVIVLLIKPNVFFTFSLPSASLDLKVPILAGKHCSRRQSTTSFSENVEVTERSFIILRSGEAVTFFTKGNSANFSSEKW